VNDPCIQVKPADWRINGIPPGKIITVWSWCPTLLLAMVADNELFTGSYGKQGVNPVKVQAEISAGFGSKLVNLQCVSLDVVN
jgi:hypothetical protein